MNTQLARSQTDICRWVHMEMADMDSQLLVESELKKMSIVIKGRIL
jgi:hypothetical protein